MKNLGAVQVSSVKRFWIFFFEMNSEIKIKSNGHFALFDLAWIFF